jgi:hypothetical protein
MLQDYVVMSLLRDARSSQMGPSVIDARYWQLLADLVAEGGPQIPGNAISLLHALGQAVLSDESILATAAPVLSHFSIQGASVELTSAALEIWLRVAATTSDVEASFEPLRLLIGSWTEGVQTKKHSVPSAALLRPFCEAYARAKELSIKLQSILCRLSMHAYAVDINTQKLAEAAQSSAVAGMILEQICLSHKHNTTDQRNLIWSNAVQPFLRLSDATALREVLEVAAKYKLYPANAAPESALLEVVHRVITNSRCLEAIHRIDERIFTTEIWTEIVARLPNGSEPIVTLLCESMSRRRSLDRMVDILLAADRVCWTDQMDVALSTQVGEEQSTVIMDILLAHAGRSDASLQLATNVIRALEPVQQPALGKLHDDVAAPLMATGRAGHALCLINAITLRAEEPLTTRIHESQVAYLQNVPDDVLTKHQTLLAVLERLRRGKDEVSQRWLSAFLPLADDLALDLIALAYLPMLERTASEVFLGSLAKRLLADDRTAALLAKNAANLEIARYRTAWKPVNTHVVDRSTIDVVAADLPYTTAVQAVIAGRRPRELAVLLADFSRRLDATNYFGIVTALITVVRRCAGTLQQLLPQLSVLLCQLVAAVRDVNEARQLTRLCTAIAASKELSDAMAVHAVPVLQAYVRAITRPGFVIGEARQEVMRAMYCMCELVSVWQRSVLMDFLADDGQRIVCRQLWRSYEAQRYKGV